MRAKARKTAMTKRARQYIGLLAAIASYYVIHEGAHFVYALLTGTFKTVNFMGLGMQIDIHADKMTETQLGLFCLVGSVATALFAYLLVFLAKKIASLDSKVFKACAYYVTLAVLIIDPLYLALLSPLFGGGDMNGIALIVPPIAAKSLYGALLIINALVFMRVVLPTYKEGFKESENE